MNDDFPIDPVLPEGFDSTANEDRTTAELDAWWDRPFAVTRPDGGLTVRCLHGGSWDRSTWMGDADTLEQAKALARAKLAEWQAIRARPTTTIYEGGKVSLVRMEQRPDQQPTVLGTFDSLEEAAAFHKAQQGE